MKIIGFEEHYGLPAIYEAAKKTNDPYLQVLEKLRKAGHFPDDSKSGFPAGIYDLGERRIAAMDDAVQILSYATPSAERLDPSLSRDLTRQANDTVAAVVSKHPDRFLGFATLPMLDPAAEHRGNALPFDRDYPGVHRTDDCVFFQITLNAGRSVELKQSFYKELTDRLHQGVKLRKEDVFINLVEVPKENWSYGNGLVQYASR